jgi:hypothetical protein
VKHWKEVNLTLGVQALIPFLLTGIPSMIGQYLHLAFGERPQEFMAYSLMIRTLIPLFNPLITLFCIRSLRSKICAILQKSAVEHTPVVHILSNNTML